MKVPVTLTFDKFGQNPSSSFRGDAIKFYQQFKFRVTVTLILNLAGIFLGRDFRDFSPKNDENRTENDQMREILALEFWKLFYFSVIILSANSLCLGSLFIFHIFIVSQTLNSFRFLKSIQKPWSLERQNGCHRLAKIDSILEFAGIIIYQANKK